MNVTPLAPVSLFARPHFRSAARSRFRSGRWIALLFLSFATLSAFAQTITTIRTFAGGTADGEASATSLVQAADGTLYGVATNGGANGRGVLYKLKPDGTEYTVLFSFPSSAGAPEVLNGRNNSFILGTDGVLYGTSRFGGTSSAGTLYKINRDGTGFTVLHSFAGTPSGGGNDGREPNGGLIMAADGNLYGCTGDGSGPGNSNRGGTIFKVSTSGSGYQVICNFLPSSTYPTVFGPVSLMQASDGKLYGAAIGGAASSATQLAAGALFSLNTDGTAFTPLFFFTSSGAGAIGGAPESQLIQLDGKLYGVARSGGSSLNGSLFRLNFDGTGFQTLYSLTGGANGDGPENNFFLGRDGSFYGSTRFGGTNNQGVVYKIRPDGTGFRVLAQKAGSPNRGYFGVMQGLDSALYGTPLSTNTSFGTIYRLVEATGPTLTSQPSSATAALGSNVTLTVAATGATSYQWRRNGIAIAGATNAALTLTALSTSNFGNYDVVVTNSAGSTTSATAILLVNDGLPTSLSNVSVRTTLAANQLMIVGLTMRGGSKPVLLRAAGPALGALGVPGTMANPKLAVFKEQTKEVENDDWRGDPAVVSAGAALGAFPFTNNNSLDAALVHSFDSGRTVQISGPTGGNVIVEAYDAGPGTSQRLTNLAARNFVGTGNDILAAGFTISGSSPKNVLIRAAGPSLGALGVLGTLVDPKLQLFSATNPPVKIDENDNYSASLPGMFTSVGAFGFVAGAKDAALMVRLSPGGYTVQVSGADGGTGEAIIEIYELP